MTTYQVKSGDTLYSIAQKKGISVEALAQINGIKDANKLQTGQKLIFSLPADENTDYKPTTTPEQKNISEHKIKKGDTLWKLSKQYGCSIDALKAANNLKSDTIQENTILIIPTAAQKTNSTPKNKTINQTTSTSDNPQENIKADIRKAEGKEPLTYFAPEGKATIGYGHQLVNKPAFLKKIENQQINIKQKTKLLQEALKKPENVAALKAAIQKDLAAAIKNTGIKTVPSTINSDLSLTDTQIELLLSSDVKTAHDNAQKNLGKAAFDKLSTAQKEVMIDLYYNIGENFHNKGPTFTKLVKQGDYTEAQSELDFYRSNGKILRGLMKRSLERMEKWNNNELTQKSKDSILDNYNKYAVQEGKPKVKTFEEAKQKILAP